MGLLIHTTFTTSEGFPVTNVYCRIGRIIYDPSGGTIYSITLQQQFYLNRQCRLEGKRVLSIPGLSELISFEGELHDMSYLYGLLKTELVSRGFTVEDVLEPPAPEPAPAPAPEPAPTEPVPASEVSPQSSEPTQ